MAFQALNQVVNANPVALSVSEDSSTMLVIPSLCVTNHFCELTLLHNNSKGTHSPVEPNGGGEAGDSGADDDDIEGALFFHGALMILSLCFSSSLIYFIILSKNNALEDGKSNKAPLWFLAGGYRLQ